MTDAIITQLKTGSLTRVYARGDNVEDKVAPYVIVANAGNTGPGNLNQEQYFVTPHFARGFWFELGEYMDEARGLLSGAQLTDGTGATAVLESSGAAGALIDTNDDNTISRELTFVAPGMVL